MAKVGIEPPTHELSGLGGSAPGDVNDEPFGSHVDEFLVVSHFLEFPFELVAKLGLLVPAELVLAVEFGGACERFFKDAGQALLRHHLGGIIGDMIVIADGLKEGDEIVREGAEYLTGGEIVQKKESDKSGDSDLIKGAAK